MLANPGTLLFLTAGLLAQGPSSPAPIRLPNSNLQSFYVVIFEGGPFSFTVLDVRSDSQTDSAVRYIEIYPACGTYHVRAKAKVFENIPIEKLAGQADLCVSEESVAAVVNAARRKHVEEVWQDQYDIAADCGTETVIHRLPWLANLKFNMIQTRAPRIAAFWALPEDLRREMTGDTKAGEAAASQSEEHRVSEQAAIDIRGGAFNLAVPDLPPRQGMPAASKLSELVPDFPEATAPEEDFGVVEDLEQLGVEKYENIRYPQLAKIAHIQGEVELEVAVNAQAGTVMQVTPVSGHPILRLASIEAAKNWIFFHPYLGPNPVRFKIHFAVRCGATIQTNAAYAATPPKKAKKKRKH